MSDFLTAMVCGLLVTLAIGLGRVVRGPSDNDRLLGVLLVGTTGVAILMVLATQEAAVAILDVALVLAMLAPITTAAYISVRSASRGSKQPP